MRRARTATCGFVLVLGAFVPSCSGKDVTVFELAASGASGSAALGGGGAFAGGGQAGSTTDSAGRVSELGGSAGSAGGTGDAGGIAEIACRTNRDCGQGWLCEKPSCDSETGVCDLRPGKTDLDYAPVCGCDGVTYWNDVIRRQAGESLLAVDQCSTTVRPCDVDQDCGVMFPSCARLVSRGEQCSPSSSGACWVLPPDCPDPVNDPDIWQECRPPMPGVPPPPCLDTCRAIRSERPQQRPRDLKLCP